MNTNILLVCMLTSAIYGADNAQTHETGKPLSAATAAVLVHIIPSGCPFTEPLIYVVSTQANIHVPPTDHRVEVVKPSGCL